MSSKRKTIFNLVFLVVVFVLTIHFVFRGEDIGDILQGSEGCRLAVSAAGIGLCDTFLFWENQRSFSI